MTMYSVKGFSAGDGQKGEDPNQDIDLAWAVKVPMRDGICLNATLFKPHHQNGPLPVVIGLTPYNADVYTPRGMFFARNGYVFAAVDCRGRGNSDGVFEPVIHESRDTHDLIEWFAQQPYCNGQVTMSGASYGGFDQWAATVENPPHLSAILPTAAGYPSYDFPFSSNIFSPYFINWLTLTSGKTANFNLFGEDTYWLDKHFELYKNHRPLVELDAIAGNTASFYQKWMDNILPGAYWDQTLPSEQTYRGLNIPVLTVTGHYDGDQKGALGYYANHMRWGTPEAKANHYLIIGPWDHGGTGNPQKEFGGLKFADASKLNMNQLHKEWYDWVLKGGPKPDFLQKRVAYYVTGAEEWKYADTLDEIGSRKMNLYLNDHNGQANSVFQSGKLQSEPSEKGADSFVYDPLDIRPGELEQANAAHVYEDYLINQRMVLNLFDNGLVYHTEPFEKDTEVSGFVKLTAWIEMDVPDTDFEVNLYEITPQGGSILLTGDTMRARYRNSLRNEELVPVGEIVEYTFSGFTFFSRQVQQGSRLRLVFKCINSINFEKNYNSGGKVRLESGKDARTAHVKLYHDAQHASCLEIPLG